MDGGAADADGHVLFRVRQTGLELGFLAQADVKSAQAQLCREDMAGGAAAKYGNALHTVYSFRWYQG